MKKYKYVAVNLQRKKFTGTFLADDEKHLATQLAQQNLYLVSATIASDTPQGSFLTLGAKVKLSELTTFSRQFAIMINAGMSIMQTLEILKTQSYSAYFKSVLEMIHEDVKGGVMMSEALSKHKKVFPDFFRSMIYVGEASGKLDTVMNSLADYYESDSAIRKKTKSAMSYPLMLLGMTVGIVVLMMVFVIPTFKESLSAMDVEMPALTQTIYDMSDFMVKYWMYVLGGVVLAIIAFFLFGKTEKGKYAYDTLALNVPLFKVVQINKITARFARGFGLLMSSGMDIVDALEVINIVLGNRNIEKRFKLATEDVRQGMSLTMAFDSYALFPEMLIQMISVGEKTGSIDEVLTRSCKFFDEQAQDSLMAFTGAIQPIMLIFMGGVVGILFVAIYTPMLSIMQTIG